MRLVLAAGLLLAVVGTAHADGRVKTVPTEAVAPRYLECHGGKFCVSAQKFADAGNLLVYANASAPTLIVDAETFLQEGTSRTLPVYVSDPDGDAVHVTAELIDTPAPLTVSVNETGEGAEVLLTALPVGCEDKVVRIRVIASDGLAEHDVFQNVAVRIIHSRRPNPPQIDVSNIIVEAGAPDFPITLTEPPNACPTSYEWTELAPGSSTTPDAGLSRTFSTPPTLCAPGGTTYVYSVKSVERRPDLISDPTYFTVQVLPWGRPYAPFQEGEKRERPSGERVELEPQRTHACDGDPGSGFPGVDTLWVLTSGGRADGGVRLLTEDEKPIVGASAVTPKLFVETDRCVGANLEFSVQHFSRGNASDAGVGPASTVRVVVDAGWDPLSRGTVPLFDITSAPNAVVGDAGVENLNCLEQRGPLKARIQLASRDGSDVRTRDFPVPGPWWFSLEDVCEGGDYLLSAELLDESGLRAEGLAVDAVAVRVPPVELPLKRLDTLYMTARCGEAARGVLEQPIPAGPCSRIPITWTQLSGTPLTQPTFTGQRIEVATQVTDFGALIGESVGMRVTANTGVVSEVDQVVRITTEPFVEVQRITEKATGTDADLIGVSVELSNTTACDVSQVDHVEQLEGVDYVPGSARFNGTPVEPEPIPEGIQWKGLVLEGNSMGRLTYVVRPRLLEKPRFEGQSSLRDIPISQPLEEPPPAGCGCAGGGSGAAVMGLVGLLAALRRRRGV